MSDTVDQEALAILRRLEPALGRLQEDLGAVKQDVAAIKATLPHLATKAEVHQLGYSLSWRFITAIIVVLVAYLGAVWWVVTPAAVSGWSGFGACPLPPDAFCWK